MTEKTSLEDRISELEEDMRTHTKKFQTIRNLMKTEPEVFGFDDMAQQIIGASLLSSSFCATEEIWRLANSITWNRLGFISLLSISLGILLIYFTDYQKVADHKRFGQYVPIRIISLVCVSYGMVSIILSVLGVFTYGGELGFEPLWRIKVIILVGFFAILGGAVADVIR
ncbi:MAG: DUF2391 family protein [Theionarchaea archaeon]|nr:DUF2391 family protein [Theionarchaea archaeon]